MKSNTLLILILNSLIYLPLISRDLYGSAITPEVKLIEYEYLGSAGNNYYEPIEIFELKVPKENGVKWLASSKQMAPEGCEIHYAPSSNSNSNFADLINISFTRKKGASLESFVKNLQNSIQAGIVNLGIQADIKFNQIMNSPRKIILEATTSDKSGIARVQMTTLLIGTEEGVYNVQFTKAGQLNEAKKNKSIEILKNNFSIKPNANYDKKISGKIEELIKLPFKPDELISFKIPEKPQWKVLSHQSLPDRCLLEFIPVDQKLENWSDFLRIQFFEKSGFSIDDLACNVRKSSLDSSPGAKVTWKVIEKNDKELVYETLIDSQHTFIPSEQELSRVILTPNGFYLVGIEHKGTHFTSKEKEDWLEILKKDFLVTKK